MWNRDPLQEGENKANKWLQVLGEALKTTSQVLIVSFLPAGLFIAGGQLTTVADKIVQAMQGRNFSGGATAGGGSE